MRRACVSRCSECSKLFRSERHLDLHLKRKHEENAMMQKREEERAQAERERAIPQRGPAGRGKPIPSWMKQQQRAKPRKENGKN